MITKKYSCFYQNYFIHHFFLNIICKCETNRNKRIVDNKTYMIMSRLTKVFYTFNNSSSRTQNEMNYILGNRFSGFLKSVTKVKNYEMVRSHYSLCQSYPAFGRLAKNLENDKVIKCLLYRKVRCLVEY